MMGLQNSDKDFGINNRVVVGTVVLVGKGCFEGLYAGKKIVEVTILIKLCIFVS